MHNFYWCCLYKLIEVSFEPDPQALRSIINSEGMTPVRVAAPKRQTTSGAVIRQVLIYIIHLCIFFCIKSRQITCYLI